MTVVWEPGQLEAVPCEICGRPAEGPWVVRPDGLEVVKCACGFAFLSPRPKEDQVARLYQRDYYGSSGGVGYAEYRGEKARKLVGGVARKNILYLRQHGWNPTGSRLLEVGCAFGDFCAEATRVGAITLGVDLNPEGIAEAQAAHPQLAFRAGTTSAVLEAEGPASFDVVCAYEVIEHCLSIRQFLGELTALVRSGGLLALSTPNLAKALTLDSPERWLGFTSSFEHLTFLSPEVLKRLAGECGLELLTMTSVEQHRVARLRKPGFRLRDALHPLGDWDTGRRMADFDPRCQGHQLNAIFRKP